MKLPAVRAPQYRKLPHRQRTIDRAYGGTKCATCVRNSYVSSSSLFFISCVAVTPLNQLQWQFSISCNHDSETPHSSTSPALKNHSPFIILPRPLHLLVLILLLITHTLFHYSIVRAFLIEEHKIVKRIAKNAVKKADKKEKKKKGLKKERKERRQQRKGLKGKGPKRVVKGAKGTKGATKGTKTASKGTKATSKGTKGSKTTKATK
jgi:hypothetical protein